MINIIRTLFLFIGLYLLIFSIVFILIPNIDVLIKFALIIILFVIWKANEKLMNFIDFFSTTWKILALSMLSVILGLGEIYLILKIFDFIVLRSKYIENIEMTNENTATFLLVILILWYYLSYISFKICISSLEKITIKQIRILELNSTHFKLLEAGAVLAGFVSVLASVIITTEINSIMNSLIAGAYLFCLIPYMYFHFNEQKY